MYSFCTLFDSNYIDKGLVTIESLKNHIGQEKIYILSMDSMCFELLNKIYRKEKDIVILSLDEFESDELKEIKKSRSRAEYCWTCSASLIAYVLEVYQEEFCTYIDADLCFYNDPRCVIDEMENHNKTVQIIEHRFKMNYDGKLQQLNSGRFCVEFMTFKNEEKSRRVLEIWRRQIIDNCSENSDMSTFGDQMYLNSWEDDYDNIWVTPQLGAGVAPWNVNRYKLEKDSKDEVMLLFDNGEIVPLIFYHFHHISYLNEYKANINIRTRYWKVDEKLVQRLYIDYLKRLEMKKNMLKHDYGYRIIRGSSESKEKNKINVYQALRRPKLIWRVRYAVANLMRVFMFGSKDIINLQMIV